MCKVRIPSVASCYASMIFGFYRSVNTNGINVYRPVMISRLQYNVVFHTGSVENYKIQIYLRTTNKKNVKFNTYDITIMFSRVSQINFNHCITLTAIVVNQLRLKLYSTIKMTPILLRILLLLMFITILIYP